MPKNKAKSLKPDELRLNCDPKKFSFETTEDLPALEGFIGQARAVNAVYFGTGIAREGFNIFALGEAGAGKRSVILSLLGKEAKNKPQPKDICYIHNFELPRHPNVLLLEPGLGKKLAEDMRQLIELLRISLPAIFESKAYTTRIKEIQEETRRKQESAFLELDKEAEEQNIAIMRTAEGFVLAATKNGQIISEEEFATLPKEEKEKKEAIMRVLHDHLMSTLEQTQSFSKEQQRKIRESLKYFTMLQVGSVINEVQKKYENQPEISAYLSKVQQAILDNPTEFRKKSDGGLLSALGVDSGTSTFNRYRVNVLVDNSTVKGAPIVYEDNPTFSNLVGHIDHVSQFGALVTDFTLIRAGALQKANGGYLLMDAHKLLSQPFSWEGLKRALRAKEVFVENMQQLLGIAGTVTLEPNPVPLDIKVVLFGSRQLYYILCAVDPEFLDLFKVAADFDEDIERTPENELLFAQLLKNIAKKYHLKPLTKDAVALVIEHGSRMVEDRQKISTHVRRLSDLLREADHCSALLKKSAIDKSDVEKAINQQIERASRLKEKQYEFIARGTVLIDTDGSEVGQTNALSVVELGGFAFGYPTRITASVASGKGDLIDIEREVRLGGPIHSKGVLILAGFLNERYARNKPLSLSASLVFEQTYGRIEGDSATIAETCALLSAIGMIPIKQSIGITGSMNQHGYVQPIGGVNEKIEGFFDVCKERGLSGEQGVIIPKTNVDRLMLRKDIVDAAKKKKFHIFPVETIDEAMEILTDLKAGTKSSTGLYPRNSINGRLFAALSRFAKRVPIRR